MNVSILAGSTNDTAYGYADEWMADIPDDALLSSVNIPATHDTGTAGVVQDLGCKFITHILSESLL